MDVLARAVSAIDWINRCVGRVVAWLTLATVLICGAVVLLRYSAGIGLVWLQELYVWTHAMTFLLAAGFAYLLNAHVRVDIFYARLSARGKAWVDLLGVVFLWGLLNQAWWSVAIPIAILVNAVRVAGTGWLAHTFGADVATGFYHTIEGFGMFGIAFVLLACVGFGAVWLLPGPSRETA